MPHAAHRDLPVRTEKRAKAFLRKPESREVAIPDAAMARVGATVERARNLRGWSLQELAREAGNRNERQIARWIKGLERTQFDVLFAIKDARWCNALVVAIAELACGVEIDTVIRLRMKESA